MKAPATMGLHLPWLCSTFTSLLPIQSLLITSSHSFYMLGQATAIKITFIPQVHSLPPLLFLSS